MPVLGNLNLSIMMKVLIVSSSSHLAGHYWSYTADFASAIASQYIQADIYASLPPKDSTLIENPLVRWFSCASWITIFRSLKQRELHWESRLENLLRNLEFAVCLQRSLRSQGNSHIHCIESRHRLLLNAVLQSKRNFSSLCVGSPTLEAKKMLGPLYRSAFSTGRLKFIVETEAVRSAWEELAGANVVHIPVAASNRSESPLNKQECRKCLGLPEDAFVCLFFGTHREGKDYRTAIEAARISRANPFLLFAGPIISGNDPDALLKEYGYLNAVSLKHFFIESEATILFDACDAVVLPYAKGYEKGSAVLLQACKYGKPVIASDTGHLSYFVNKHKTGRLFTPGNPQSLANVFNEMAQLDNYSTQEINFHIKNATHEYTWNQLIFRYSEIFKTV